MTRKAALITVHGMGRTTPNYADSFRDTMNGMLGPALFANLHFGSVFYQDILQIPEDAYWTKVMPKVGWSGVREELLFGFADAAGLETNKDRPNSAYTLAQKAIATTFYQAWQEVGDEGPIVIFAHSLGCQVLSNYLWDAQQFQAGQGKTGIWQNPQQYAPAITGQAAFPAGLLNFLGGGSLRAFFTVGCNIPIFVAAQSNIQPINRPRPDFEWHNYYDRDDVLGWPLADLSPAYGALVIDHDVDVGGSIWDKLARSWNPGSHSQYWVTQSILNDLKNKLTPLLQ